MKSFLFIFTLIFSVPYVNAQVGQTIPYLPGIPVMDGFEILPDSILVFDKPQGQIAQVSLVCDQSCPSKTSVNEHYDSAFRGLGWTKKSPAKYQKNGHEIRYDYVSSSEGQQNYIVTFYSE